jgi:hypothetical protein
MKRTWRFAALVGAFALLAVTTTASGQTAVTRPWTMTAESQQVIIMSTGAVEARARGVASHFGLFTADGWGSLTDPVLQGTMTAANGDLVEWVGRQGSPLYTITGGTGRFLGATGAYVVTVQSMVIAMDSDGNLIINLKWTAVGTITY